MTVDTALDQLPQRSNAPATVEEVKKLRVDALYGKKKHYNAADRKQAYHKRVGIPLTVINVALGSYLFGCAASVWPAASNWVGGALALVAAALAALQTFFNFERQAERHRSVATRYLSIAKACTRLIAYHHDGHFTDSRLRKRLEELADRYDEVTVDSEKCPTSNGDYQKAQQGFADEETYTAAELSYKGE